MVVVVVAAVAAVVVVTVVKAGWSLLSAVGACAWCLGDDVSVAALLVVVVVVVVVFAAVAAFASSVADKDCMEDFWNTRPRCLCLGDGDFINCCMASYCCCCWDRYWACKRICREDGLL